MNRQFYLISRQTGMLLVRPASAFQRSYSSRLTNNFIFKSIKYVNDVDEAQHKLVSDSTVENKIDQLITRISKQEELLYLLALFQSECHKLGIERNIEDRKSSFKFYLIYYLRLKPIHNSFWDMCHLMGISNNSHKIGPNVKHLGLLDPSNFDPKFLQQLQSGRYGGVDFRHVESFSNTRPDWSDASTEKTTKTQQ